MNGHFAQARARTRQCRGHLRLNTKAILREHRENFSQQRSAEKFVSSLHVVDIKSCDLVAEKCQQAIDTRVKNSPHAATKRVSPSISKHGREWFICQRVEQSGVVIWVIFQITILGDHRVHVAGLLQRPFKPSAKRRAFAKIHRVREQLKL